MDENLKHIFQSKLEDYQVEPCPDDWKIIEQRLLALERKKRRVVIFRYLSAASVILLLGIGMLFVLKQNSSPIANSVLITNPNDSIKNKAQQPPQFVNLPVKTGDPDNTNRPLDTGKTIQKSIRIKPVKILNATNNRVDTIINKGQIYFAESGGKKEDSTGVKQASLNQDNKLVADNHNNLSSGVDTMSGKTVYAWDNTTIDTNSINNQKLALSTFTPSATPYQHEAMALSVVYSGASNNSSTSNKTVVPPPMLLGASNLRMTSLDEMKVLGKNISTQHDVPLTFGLLLRKNLNRRFAVETGLKYTFLHSTFTSQISNNEQNIHYLGIPVSMVYKVKDWGRLSFYLSAGGMVEKSIAADYTGDVEYNKIETINGVQWSVNGYAGLNYRFYKQLGLYIEPGWVYYFPDGSDVITIRSDQPSAFSFQIGLRLNM